MAKKKKKLTKTQLRKLRQRIARKNFGLTKKTRKRARITVKSLLADVRKKMNKEKVEAVIAIVEEKYKELEAAKGVVRKLQ
ncbi:hypothetical protein LCGC14_2518250, partial [marine sediment metagenome]